MIENAGPLKIVVSGIECMNDNYSKVDVLYANAKIVNENEELNLQKIANDLSDHFYERGNYTYQILTKKIVEVFFSWLTLF